MFAHEPDMTNVIVCPKHFDRSEYAFQVVGIGAWSAWWTARAAQSDPGRIYSSEHSDISQKTNPECNKRISTPQDGFLHCFAQAFWALLSPVPGFEVLRARVIRRPTCQGGWSIGNANSTRDAWAQSKGCEIQIALSGLRMVFSWKRKDRIGTFFSWRNNILPYRKKTVLCSKASAKGKRIWRASNPPFGIMILKPPHNHRKSRPWTAPWKPALWPKCFESTPNAVKLLQKLPHIHLKPQRSQR